MTAAAWHVIAVGAGGVLGGAMLGWIAASLAHHRRVSITVDDPP